MILGSFQITDPARFTIGVIITVAALNMVREKYASRIRNSRYWFLGWLGYLLAISLAGSLVCGSVK